MLINKLLIIYRPHSQRFFEFNYFKLKDGWTIHISKWALYYPCSFDPTKLSRN